jgi:TolB-like protein/tetratricopeptide (TPR) repeat protein
MSEPSADNVLAAMERALADPHVSSGGRSACLLRHLVKETLAGREERLKGTAIAMDVFGRGADFDPQADGIVRTEARRLRQALDSYYAGSGAEDPIRITIPKGTYVPRFERRAVSQAVGPAPDEAAGTRVRARAPWPRLPRGSGEAVQFAALAVGIGLMVALAAGVGTSLWGLDRWSRAAQDEARTPTVFVSPFDAGGDDPRLAVFAEGLTAQLIADLMKFDEFRLFTLEDALQVADGADQARAAGVDPDFLIRGLVRGDAAGVSVVVRLIDGRDGRIVWSDAYARSLDPVELVELQTAISGEIATQIAQPYGIMRNEITARLAASTADADMSSFNCVMQAYTYRYSNRRALYAPVRACLEKAVIRDPEYAEAWAMLAFLRLDGGRFGYEARTQAERGAAYVDARFAAARARALDSLNTQALKALATVEFYLGRYENSFRLARKALELNPNDPDILGQLGWRLSMRGNFAEGIDYVERAIERSVRPPPWYFQGIALERLMRGDMAGMLDAAQSAVVDGSAPSEALLAIALDGLGHHVEARAAYGRMAQGWSLLATDPAAAFARHHLSDEIIAALVNGLHAMSEAAHGEMIGAHHSAGPP